MALSLLTRVRIKDIPNASPYLEVIINFVSRFNPAINEEILLAESFDLTEAGKSKVLFLVGSHRITLLTPLGKVKSQHYFAHLKKVVYDTASNIDISFEDMFNGDFMTISGTSDGASRIANVLHQQFFKLFPVVRLVPAFDPPQVKKYEMHPTFDLRTNGNLSDMYTSYCVVTDQAPVPPVLSQFQNGNTTTIFDVGSLFLGPKNLTDAQYEPIFSAVSRYPFESVNLDKLAISDGNAHGFFSIAVNSCTLASLSLVDVMISKKHLTSFFGFLATNQHIPLHTLNLQGLPLDCEAFVSFLAARQRSFSHLNLSNCFPDTASLCFVLNGLLANKTNLINLKEFKLGGIKEEQDCGGSMILSQVLSLSPCLTYLALNQIPFHFPSVFQGLMQCPSLRYLDISQNKMTNAHQWSGIDQLLASLKHFEQLDISNTGLPLQILQSILVINKNTPFALISKSNALGHAGSLKVGAFAPRIKSIRKLDISDNRCSVLGLISLVKGLAVNNSITWLSLNGNFECTNKDLKDKLCAQLALLVSSTVTSISTLQIRGSQQQCLGPSLGILFENFPSQSPLKELDISHQYMGDQGTISLSKMIRRNSSLHLNIIYDHNEVTSGGIKNLQSAYKLNPNVKCQAIPCLDWQGIVAGAH